MRLRHADMTRGSPRWPANDFAFLLRSKMVGASEAREDNARRDSSKR